MKPNTYFKIENENQLISLFDDHKTDFYVQDFDQLHERFTDGYHYAVKDNTGKIRLATHKVGVEVNNPYKSEEQASEHLLQIHKLLKICGWQMKNIELIKVIINADKFLIEKQLTLDELSIFVEENKK